MDHVKTSSGMTLRKERAINTRRRISDSARRLFFVKGYSGTTLHDVAEEAGVAVQTVYAVYKSKAGILRSLREIAVNQPEADGAYGQALSAETVEESLKLLARSIRMRWENVGDIVEILGDAAKTDESVREEIEVASRARRNGINQFAISLNKRFTLPIESSQATAILLALSLPEVHREFVVSNGWPEEKYEEWLSAAMRRELL